MPTIDKLELNLPHVQIIGTNHYGNKRWEAFEHNPV